VSARLNATLALRDEWRTKENAEVVATSSHSDLVHYVLKTIQQGGLEAHANLNAFLNVFLNTNRHDLFNQAEVKKVITLNTESRMYRIVTAIDDPGNVGDHRLRELLCWILDNKPHFSIYALFVGFFTHIERIAHSAPKGDQGIWKTKPATIMEKMVFLSMVAELMTTTKDKESHKVTSSAFLTPPPSQRPSTSAEVEEQDDTKLELFPACPIKNFALSKSHAQHVGFLIQYVSRAWDLLAQDMCYKNLEELVSPYITFDTTNCRFDVIKTREEGYMPLAVLKHFSTELKPTMLPVETFPGVVDLPHNVDRSIRVIVKHYLNDLRKMVFAATMYTDIDQMQLIRRIKKFRVTGHGLPERFASLNADDVEKIRASRRESLGIAMPVPAANEDDSQDPWNANESPAKSSLLEDLHDSIRDRAVPRNVYKRKMAMVQRVKQTRYSSELASAREELRDFMKDYCLMCGADYQYFTDNIEEAGVRPVLGNTQLVLIDPPYNIRRERRRENSSYDHLFPDDMNKVIQLVDDLLRPGGHCIIFCSVQQFPEWSNAFNTYHRRQEQLASSANSGSGKTFNVDLTP